MIHNDKQLLELIDSANYFDDEPERNEKLRGALKNIFSNLNAHQQTVLNEIKEYAVRPQPQTENLNVITALINQNDVQKNYFEFAPVDAPSNGIFIDLDYEPLRELVGDIGDRKIFNGTFEIDGAIKNFRYTLEFDRRFLDREEILLRVLALYHAAPPVIFSPFARKAFKVKFIDDVPNSARIDYKFADNNIPAVTDLILCSNVECTLTDFIMPDAQKPCGDLIMHKYSFERGDQPELYLPSDDKILIFDIDRAEDSINLWLNAETAQFYKLEYKSVDAKRKEIAALELNGRLHQSAVEQNKFSVSRILTRADLEYAIRPFRQWNGLSCRLVEQKELSTVAPRYMSKYSHRGSKRLTVRPLHKAYLKFDGADRKKFPTDCINYVLGWLQYHYPEVEWIGGS